MSGLAESDLPSFWRQADSTARHCQRQTLCFNGMQLGGALVAALGAVLTWQLGRLDVAALIITFGFLIALAGQCLLLTIKPEVRWYEGRALAESAKTLAWRFAVGLDPFPISMAPGRARQLLAVRLGEVHSAAPNVVIDSADDVYVSSAMEALRSQSFESRRAAYIEGRTREQQQWYSDKAKSNRDWAHKLAATIVVAELVALTVAAIRVFGTSDVDVAGFLAAIVGIAVAWLAIRQHTSLATAYSIASAELIKQAEKLQAVDENDWALYAADAEEAISREHTLWLASRTSSLSVGDVVRPDEKRS